MFSTAICHIVTDEDKKIAEILGFENPEKGGGTLAATLRGIFDERAKQDGKKELQFEDKDGNITDESIKNAAEKLKKLRRKLINEEINGINDYSSSVASAYLELYDSYDAKTLMWRTQKIASMFSTIVNTIQRKFPDRTREEIINGFTDDNGRNIAGEFAIFDAIYKEIERLYYNEDYEVEHNKKDAYLVNAYARMLENFKPLASLARSQLLRSEGIIIGNKLKYGVLSTEENFNDNIESEFSMEENEKESWQEERDKIPAFGTISEETRRILSSIPYRDDGGNVVMSDMGDVVYMDPALSHSYLQNLLHGMVSESNMLDIIYDEYNKALSSNTYRSRIWLSDLMDKLEDDNLARTAFYVDMKKARQLYLGTVINPNAKHEYGTKHYVTKILNKHSEVNYNDWANTYFKGYADDNSLFDESGNVRSKIVEELIINIKSLFVDDFIEGGRFKKKGYSEILPEARRVFDILGIPVSDDEIRLLKMKEEIRRKISLTFRDMLESLNLAKDKKTFNDFLNAEFSVKSQNGKDIKVSFGKSIKGLFQILDYLNNDSRTANKANFFDKNGNNSTFYSYVASSFLSDFYETIQAYVRFDDKQGLEKFIKERYLESSYFKKDINNPNDLTSLNLWINDILECCKDNKPLDQTMAGILISPMKYLGFEKTCFSKMGEKLNAISIIHAYLSQENNPNNTKNIQITYYPTFILGDSGARQYIKARKYDEKTIINGFKNIELQERRRMQLQEQTDNELKSKKKGSVKYYDKNISHVTLDADGNIVSIENPRYTMLTFLNDDFESFDGSKGKYSKILNDIGLEDAIKSYLDDYVRYEIENLEKKKVFERDASDKLKYFGGEIYDDKFKAKIKDFIINQKFAMMQQLQLFALDPAFYKSITDLQKRYKEVYASGTELSLEAEDENGIRFLDSKRAGMQHAVYFNDIVLSGEYTDPDFMKVVEKHLKGEYRKYLENSLTDGQSYRTLKSYRSVLGMAGRWTHKMEMAYNQINALRKSISNGTATKEDIRKLEELAVSFQPIKPFSFFHEKYKTDNNDINFIPVQHKCAEALIIPELLPKDSKLAQIGRYMEDNDIDIALATSAVKVGSYGSVDIDFKTNEKGEYIDKDGNVITDKKDSKEFYDKAVPVSDYDSINDCFKKAVVHKLSYRGYRLQGFYNEHNFTKRSVGTQARKHFFTGIRLDGDYSKYIKSIQEINGDYKDSSAKIDTTVNINGNKVRLSGKNLITLYNQLVMAEMFEGFNTIQGLMNDPKKLSQSLTQAILSSDRIPNNSILGVSYDEDTEYLKMALGETSLSKEAASLIWSLFKKKVQQQSIMGGSGIQVSSMGVSIQEDKNLKIETDGENNVTYFQVEIPFDLHYTDSNGNTVNLKFEDYCNEDGSLKMHNDARGNEIPLLEHHFPGSTTFIAYRVPTENHYSMINCKVKRFSKRTEGGMIRVPAPGTTVSGFDFDIDKLYFMRRDYKVVKDEKGKYDSINDFAKAIANGTFLTESYDFDKSVLENTRASRNNLFIDLIQQRLLDEETIKSRLKPGGFSTASLAAKKIRELKYGNFNDGFSLQKLNDRVKNEKWKDPEPNRDASSLSTLLYFNNQNQMSADLIGIFANHNINNVYTSFFGTFSLNSLRKDIERGLFISGRQAYDFLKAQGVSDTLAELVAASVDAVKDPVLNYINLNSLTADVGCLLARLGYSLDEIGYFLNQPIIIRLCENCFNNNKPLSQGIKELMDWFGEEDSNERNKMLSEDMAKAVYESRENPASYIKKHKHEQYLILKEFDMASKYSTNLGYYVNATRYSSSNTISSNFGDVYTALDNMNKFNDVKLISMQLKDKTPLKFRRKEEEAESAEEYFKAAEGNPFAFENCIHDLAKKTLKLTKKYFPYENKTFSKIRKDLGRIAMFNLSGADINSIHQDLTLQILMNYKNTKFDPDFNIPVVEKEVRMSDFYRDHFPKFLMDFIKNLNSEGKNDYEILKLLTFNIDKDGGYIITIPGFTQKTTEEKDNIINSIYDMYKNEETRPYAEDLFFYAFHTQGFSEFSGSLMASIPMNMKTELSFFINNKETKYSEMLKDIVDSKRIMNTEEKYIFVKKYILNHIENPRFTRHLNLEDLGINENLLSFDNISFNIEETPNIYIGTNKEDEAKKVIPVISINHKGKTIYYMAKSESYIFNETHLDNIIYEKVDPLSVTKNKVNYADSLNISAPEIITQNDNVEEISNNVSNIFAKYASEGNEITRQIFEEFFENDFASYNIEEIKNKVIDNLKTKGLIDDNFEKVC